MVELSLCKLASVLLITPILYSLLAQKRIIIDNQKCVIGPARGGETDGTEDFFGIWLSPNDHQRNYLNRCEIRHPSFTKVTDRQRFSVDLDGASFQCDKSFHTVYDNTQKAWCFVYNHDVANIGTKPRVAHSVFCQESNDRYPPSGSYISKLNEKGSNAFLQAAILADCTQSKTNEYSYGGRSSEFYPTTSVLLILNIGLAYIYWDRRIDPSSVCKQYSKIVSDMQLWRSFSGALAHFEALHLLFNMMTLQSLGASLEPLYGSVPFLYYNICMIPLTTIIMMGLIRLQIKRNPENEQYYAQTSSVGFSGVLFAWSVVTSLESYGVCPIPFVKDMCFTTHSWSIMGSSNMNLKFNFGPFVQLLLVHFIMPRASFIGHLSGIICGFLFHWKFLPMEIIWSPQVLIPLLLLLHWRYFRKIIPLRDSNGGILSAISLNAANEGTINGNSNDVNASLSSREIEMKKRNKTLITTQKAMILSFITCLVKFGFFRSMTLSQLLCCTIFSFSILCYKSHQEGAGSGGEGSFTSSFQSLKSISRLLWRGCFITLLLALVTDAMVGPVWFISRVMIYSHYLWSSDLWLEPLILTFRWVVNFTALIVVCLSLQDLGEMEEDSIFSKVFGRIVNWSCDAYCHVFSPSSLSLSSSTTFSGGGYTLGGNSSGNKGRSRLVTESV